MYARIGRFEQARDHYEQALRLSRDVGDRTCESYTLAFLGAVYGLWGRFRPALEHVRGEHRTARWWHAAELIP